VLIVAHDGIGLDDESMAFLVECHASNVAVSATSNQEVARWLNLCMEANYIIRQWKRLQSKPYERRVSYNISFHSNHRPATSDVHT